MQWSIAVVAEGIKPHSNEPLAWRVFFLRPRTVFACSSNETTAYFFGTASTRRLFFQSLSACLDNFGRIKGALRITRTNSSDLRRVEITQAIKMRGGGIGLLAFADA